MFKVKFNSISLWETNRLKPNVKPGFSWFQPVGPFPSPLWCFLSQQLDGNVIRRRVNSCEVHLCNFGLVSRLCQSLKTALTRNSSGNPSVLPIRTSALTGTPRSICAASCGGSPKLTRNLLIAVCVTREGQRPNDKPG